MTFVKGLKRAEQPEEQIERLSIPITECGCYAWLGHHNHGYAIMTYGSGDKRKMERVTRWLCRPVPEELEVDHLCRQNWCVNPSHLEVVTHLENIRRHFAWKVANRQVCEKHGEPLRRYGKFRVCRQCRNEYQNKIRAHKHSHKGQRKFACDDCGAPYEILATPPGRGPRYGCHACLLKYKRELHRRTKGKKLPSSNPLKTGDKIGAE